MIKNILIVIVLLALGIGAYLSFGSYSTGVRSGVLMKISDRGYIFKTTEGQLNIGGFDQTSDVGVSNVWEFSVSNNEVLDELNKAMDNSQRVKLHYKERFFKLFWLGETKYFVTEVEILGNI